MKEIFKNLVLLCDKYKGSIFIAIFLLTRVYIKYVLNLVKCNIEGNLYSSSIYTERARTKLIFILITY